MYSLNNTMNIIVHFIAITLIYIIFGNTWTYKNINILYNKIGPKNSISNEEGCPTSFGTFILGLLFSVVYCIYYQVVKNIFPIRKGNLYALFITCLVLFMFFSNTYIYYNINKFFNKTLKLRVNISTPFGCPTLGGNFFHGFLLALFGFIFPVFLDLKRIPKK